MYKLTRATITFHWLTAITVIGLLCLGYYMTFNNAHSLFSLHKSIGTIALVLILARVIWRLREGWIQPLAEHKKLEVTAARAVHWVLLIAILGMPLSGVLMGATNGYGVAVFGLELIPGTPDPADPTAVLVPSPFWHKVGLWVHEWVSYLLVAAITIHITAALKHHFLAKDHTLRRMLGLRR